MAEPGVGLKACVLGKVGSGKKATRAGHAQYPGLARHPGHRSLPTLLLPLPHWALSRSALWH